MLANRVKTKPLTDIGMPRTAKPAAVTPASEPVATVETVMHDLLNSVMDNEKLPEGVMLPVVNALKKVKESIELPPTVKKIDVANVDWDISFYNSHSESSEYTFRIQTMKRTMYERPWETPTEYSYTVRMQDNEPAIILKEWQLEKLLKKKFYLLTAYKVTIDDNIDNEEYSYTFDKVMASEKKWIEALKQANEWDEDEITFDIAMFSNIVTRKIMSTLHETYTYDMNKTAYLTSAGFE